MCITFDGQWRIAETDMFAYKIVRDRDKNGKAWSMFRPDGRLNQSNHLRGADCDYRPGDRVSPKPGFYLILTKEAAEAALARYEDKQLFFNEQATRKVIRVKIPAGAKFATGFGQGYFDGADCVNALNITVE